MSSNPSCTSSTAGWTMAASAATANSVTIDRILAVLVFFLLCHLAGRLGRGEEDDDAEGMNHHRHMVPPLFVVILFAVFGTAYSQVVQSCKVLFGVTSTAWCCLLIGEEVSYLVLAACIVLFSLRTGVHYHYVLVRGEMRLRHEKGENNNNILEVMGMNASEVPRDDAALQKLRDQEAAYLQKKQADTQLASRPVAGGTLVV